MTGRIAVLASIVITVAAATPAWAGPWGTALPDEVGRPVALPDPDTSGGPAMHQVMATRHSERHYTEESITLQELSQLLWAAQGVTHGKGYRTVPSAGAKFPIEIYVIADRVEGLDPGLYHYRVGEHRLGMVRSLANSVELQQSMPYQGSIGRAAVNLILLGVVWRVEEKYGPERSERYVVVEGGAVMEHLSLEAEALGLGSVCIGGYDDAAVQAFVGTDTLPIAIVSVGRPEPGP
jgi:SagB-type dehydrogenase family enzyme